MTPSPTPVTPTIACGQGASGGKLTVGAKSAAGGADEIATTRYDMFCKDNPDIEVTFTNADFDPTQFLQDVQSGNTPDVVRIDRAIIGTYIAAGALDPLDQCVSDAGIDMSQYYDSAVKQVTFDGKVYGIPEFYDTRIVLVNDSVVQDAGLKTEDINTADWNKLTEVNKKLAKTDGGLSRIGFDPKISDFLPLWAKANGASIVSDDGLKAQLNDPKVVEALKYAVSLVTDTASWAEYKDFRDKWDFFGSNNEFVTDQVGAFPMEEWYLNVLANNSPDEGISFVPFKARDGSDLTWSGGSALAIPSSARNKSAACKFMKEITSPDAWIAASQARADKRASSNQAYTGTYSGNHVADQTIFGQLVTQQTAGKYWPGVQLVVKEMPNAFSLPAIPCGATFDTAWRDAVDAVLSNGTDAKAALDQAQKTAQEAIDAGAGGDTCP